MKFGKTHRPKLGEVSYLFVSYNIMMSRLSTLNGFRIILLIACQCNPRIKSPKKIHNFKITEFVLEVDTHSSDDGRTCILLICHALLPNVEEKCVIYLENIFVGNNLGPTSIINIFSRHQINFTSFAQSLVVKVNCRLEIPYS